MNIFRLKYIPLTIIIGFNLFTLLIFYTAPIRWVTNNLLLFFIFSLTCQLMIILGYKFGYRKSFRTKVIDAVLYSFSQKRLNFIFYFYSLTFLIKYAYLLKFSVFDIGGMFNFLSIGVADPRLGYMLSISERPATISWGVFFLISIINQIFFIAGYLKWGAMSRGQKSLFIFFLCVEVFFWMGRGTNFGIISLVTTLAFASIFKFQFEKLNFKKAIRLYSIILLLLIGSIYIFTYNMNNRRNNVKLDFQSFNLGLSKVNESDNIFKIIPSDLHVTYLYMVSYLTQGYYHTSLAFDLPFKSTYMLGNNPAIISLGDALNLDLWKDTYMYRLKDFGVDPLISWHSAYTWYASDVSFLGVPFIMFFLGYFLGFSWSLSLNKNDFLSKLVFIILANMLLYLFANNTYLASVFYSFMFILPLWFFTRVKRIKL